MGKGTGSGTKKSLFGSIRHSLRAQIGLIVLLSYLIPVVLLGVFTGNFLLKRLENQTRAAVTSGAEQAWTLTEQRVPGRDGMTEPSGIRNSGGCARATWRGSTAGNPCCPLRSVSR